jgi:hypothetical protein
MTKTRLLIAVTPACLLLLPAIAQDQTLSQTYKAQRLQIDALIANMKIDVVSTATDITVSLSGTPEMVQKVTTATSGGALVIGMDGSGGDWWGDMFEWSSVSSDDLHVTITLPPGTPVKVDNFIGDAVVGNLNAPVSFSTTGGTTQIGNVDTADLSIAGSGEIIVANVTGRVEASIAGSGTVRAGDASEATVEIAGGGDVKLGAINGQIEIDIAGSGEVRAVSVNGKVDIDVAGSGEVHIDGGKADPFKVDIAGSGDVRFGGIANNPDVSVMGSGDVWISSYTGTLSSDGADIKIGQAQ